MRYDKESVRRQKFLLEEKEAFDILQEGEYGVLSMQSETDGAYGVPLSYAWDGESSIYLHGALEGRKLRCIEKNENVSFCIVFYSKVRSPQFTTDYKSVILECKATIIDDGDEKQKGFHLLVDKYSPEMKMKAENMIQKGGVKTKVIRLDILTWTGKSKV